MATDWAAEARKLGDHAPMDVKLAPGSSPAMPRVCAWCAADAAGDVKITGLNLGSSGPTPAVTVPACATCLAAEKGAQRREMGWYIKMGIVPAVLAVAGAGWEGSHGDLQAAVQGGIYGFVIGAVIMFLLFTFLPKKLGAEIDEASGGGAPKEEGPEPAFGEAGYRYPVLLRASENPWTLHAAPGFILALKDADPAIRDANPGPAAGPASEAPAQG